MRPVAHPVAQMTDVRQTSRMSTAQIHPDAHAGESCALPFGPDASVLDGKLRQGLPSAQPVRRAFTSRGTNSTGSSLRISQPSTSSRLNLHSFRFPTL